MWGWVLLGIGGMCMCAAIPAILLPVFAQAKRAAAEKEMGLPSGFSKPSHIRLVRQFLRDCDSTWVDVEAEVKEYTKLRKTMNPPSIPPHDPAFIASLSKLAKRSRATYNGFKGLDVPSGCERIFNLQEKTLREITESEDHLLAAAEKGDRDEARKSLQSLKDFATDARVAGAEVLKMSKYVAQSP